MKKLLTIHAAVLLSVFLINTHVFPGEGNKQASFFSSSLHSTANGMAYWYSKENGGLETLTEIPYSKLTCNKCHVASCDTCHKTQINGNFAYSTEIARKSGTCLKCHKRIATVQKMDKSHDQEDVHFLKDMQCMDCHTARDVHGDGTEYKSMRQQAAVDATCEQCHDSIPPTVSHKVHKGRLDCKSCHVRQVVSCTNCHFDTFVREGKKVHIPVSGWVFLMNYEHRVTSANMQSYVVSGDKTFVMFAPQNSHSIMKKGRKCDECHATKTVRQVKEGEVTLTWLENGKMMNLKGVIPVVDGTAYNLVYQDYQDGKWVPIKDPAAPRIQYVAFGTPLTEHQLKKLSLPMGKGK